ncbi:hypothetical protein HK100_004161, partial [Physocladia obscura]
YNPNAPKSISVFRFLSIVLRKATSIAVFYLRAIFAIAIWLIALPYSSTWIFRFYFHPKLLFDSSPPPSTLVSVEASAGVLALSLNNTNNNSAAFNFAAESFHNVSFPNAVDDYIAALGRQLRAASIFFNFTLGYDYLDYVSREIVGINSSIFSILNGQMTNELTPQHQKQQQRHVFNGSGIAVEPAQLSSSNNTEVLFFFTNSNTNDWSNTVRIFFVDVFEGQVILSVLIIFAIALLCIKEYIVVNTPVDARGNPINPPNDNGDANNIADFVDPPPPPPPRVVRMPRQQQQQRQPRGDDGAIIAPANNPPIQQHNPEAAPQIIHPPPPIVVPVNINDSDNTGNNARSNWSLDFEEYKVEISKSIKDILSTETPFNTAEQKRIHHELNNAINDTNSRAQAELIFESFQEEIHKLDLQNVFNQEQNINLLLDRVIQTIHVPSRTNSNGLNKWNHDTNNQTRDLETYKFEILSTINNTLGTKIQFQANARDRINRALEETMKKANSRADVDAIFRDFQVHSEELKLQSPIGWTDDMDWLVDLIVAESAFYGDSPHWQTDGAASSDSASTEVRPFRKASRSRRVVRVQRSVEEDQAIVRELGMYMSAPKNEDGDFALAQAISEAINEPVVSDAAVAAAGGGGESSSSSYLPAQAFGGFSQARRASVDGLIGPSSISGTNNVLSKGKKRMLDESENGRQSEQQSTHGYGLRSSKRSSISAVDAQRDLAATNPPEYQIQTHTLDAYAAAFDMAPTRKEVDGGDADDAGAEILVREKQPKPWQFQRPIEDLQGLPPVQPVVQVPQPIENQAAHVPPPPPLLAPLAQPQPRQFQPALRRQPRLPQQLARPQGPIENPAPPAPIFNANLNDAFNVNVNVELGPDGIAVAEVQAQGDLAAFLELVGIQGPLETLAQNFGIALFIVFAAIGGGVWVPFVTGRLCWWIFGDVYFPVVKRAIEVGTQVLQRVSDPVLDPVVDAVLVVVAAVGGGVGGLWKNNTAVEDVVGGADSSAGTVDVGESKADNVDALLAVDVSVGVTGNASQIEQVVGEGRWNISQDAIEQQQNAEKEEEDEQARERIEFLPDRVTYVFTGYAAILFVVYNEAFTFFIAIELGAFPAFCGVLIDICTLNVFGSGSTIESRLVFYQAYPWTSYFLHWLAGTTFMFQFAGYVQSVRKIVRPGVVWFIRDPDDPQFHPMQDILEKPALSQLRKLAFGALMYAVVVVSTVGGYVVVVSLIQEAVGGAKSGAAKVWPLKWGFSQPLSEFPIDLVLFHFVVPAFVAWIEPKELVLAGLKLYFRTAARWLRLTHFLFGERMRDEENGEVGEDDPLVIKLFEEVQRQDDGGVDNDADELLDEDGEQRVAAAAAAAEPKPYLRVPNHDRIPLKPGVKVMVPMTKNEPLIGRAGENEEDIKANWTRVYVPGQLRVRLFALITLEWIFGLVIAAGLTFVPLYIGRSFFIAVHNYFANHNIVALATSNRPFSAANVTEILNSTTSQHRFHRFKLFPSTDSVSYNHTGISEVSSLRPDLPVHDLFSMAFGLLFVVGIFAIGTVVKKWYFEGRNKFLQVWNEEHNRGTGFGGKIAVVLKGSFAWIIEVGALYSQIVGKALFISFWVGIIIPALLGLLFEVYVVVPFAGERQQTRVFFILQDWALGSIYTKVGHSIIMNAPNNEPRRLLMRAQDEYRQGGIRRVHLKPLAIKVILPMVLLATGFILLPTFVTLFVEYVAVNEIFAGDSTDGLTNFVVKLSIPVGFGLYVLYEAASSTRKAVKKWMDHVRDEQYLVGRRLRNLGDTEGDGEEEEDGAGGGGDGELGGGFGDGGGDAADFLGGGDNGFNGEDEWIDQE